LGAGDKRYAYSSVIGVVWLAIVSLSVLEEDPVLLPGAGQVVHPKEHLLLGVVLVPFCEDVMDHSCPSLIPRWLQVTAEGIA
jgi:hypothetical protein